jgi:hypothetical protein
MVLAVLVTGLLLSSDSSADLARQAAVGVGIGLAGFALIEMRQSWRNMFRADLLALVALYFLTLFEFWFQQAYFDAVVPVSQTQAGLNLVLVAFGSLAIGRHVVLPQSRRLLQVMVVPTPSMLVIAVFWIAAAIGYLHMFMAVSFDPVAFWEGVLRPRFVRPWSRGSIGGWHTILIELGLFRYLLPPLAGIVLARASDYSSGQVIAVIGLGLFTLFEGFASGTRNVFAVYLLTFLVGYAFAVPYHQWKRPAVAFGIGGLLMYWATSVMLAFRGIGIARYFSSDVRPTRYLEDSTGVFVDHNLRNIAGLTEVFPAEQSFLGFEIPWLALVQPIPRALWSGKPTGLSTSIEEALGAEGYTLSTTFIGEAYMSGGYLAVVLISVVIGALAGWWTRHLAFRNSDLGILMYASGLFAFAICMRSMIWFTTGMLPAVGLLALYFVLTYMRKESKVGA